MSRLAEPAADLAGGDVRETAGGPVDPTGAAADEIADGAIQAVLRAADVLSYFARSPSRTLGVTEVAAGLKLSKAVVFRILTSLRERGYIGYDPTTRQYALGPQALLLGLACIEKNDVRRLSRDLLLELSTRTNETATLSVRTGWERIYIDQVTPDRDVKMVVPIGRPFPLHAGSSSKAFLAFLPAAEQDSYFREVRERPALTPHTVVDEAALRQELEQIRQRGFAMSRGERQPDAASVAAPVFGADGVPAAVLSVCGPIERFWRHAEQTGDRVREATNLLSRRLGHASS